MTSGTTVVLGWDALDAELLERWDLWDAFGAHHSRIETYANPHIGEPHTREVWPTLITGAGPDEHGIRAATEDEGVKWSSSTLKLAGRAAQWTIPETARAWLGRQLRQRGAEVEKFDADYYEEQGLKTVFDGRQSFPIAVPNYRTDTDDQNGFMFDRGAELGEWLDRDTEGWRPADVEQQSRVEQKMAAEAGSKLGLVRSALQREYDLVFAWFGIVDTAGHVEPAAAEPYQRRAYELAAEWTESIRKQLAPEDTLVCVSDHGLRDGHHTMDPVIASDDPGIVAATDSVFDFADALDEMAAASTQKGTPELDVLSRHDRASTDAGAGEVRDRLSDLGYV